jgi:hypothetical protein
MGTPSTATALAVVRQRLDETAAALAAADLDQLLACEAQLQSALAVLNISTPAVQDHPRIKEELTQIRLLVTQCRRLGGSMMGFIQTSLDGMGGELAVHTFRHSA